MLEDFTYCFILKLSSAEEMYFTSFDKEIICDGMKFAPNSGLEIDVIEMNDSANNYVKIRGFFEENGMTKNIYLERSEISVCFYFFKKE
ncbi:MAG UNVERIFIED_CONTAM: hypothetical protein LVQ98_02520 [Rickettsiaceae bacterium]|jgi:hypothetical protein